MESVCTGNCTAGSNPALSATPFNPTPFARSLTGRQIIDSLAPPKSFQETPAGPRQAWLSPQARGNGSDSPAWRRMCFSCFDASEMETGPGQVNRETGCSDRIGRGIMKTLGRAKANGGRNSLLRVHSLLWADTMLETGDAGDGSGYPSRTRRSGSLGSSGSSSGGRRGKKC